MKTFKTFFPLVASALILGCANIPKINIEGPYLQVYLGSTITLQGNFSTKAECEENAVSSLRNFETRNQVAIGNMRIICSATPEKLNVKSTWLEIYTNKQYIFEYQNMEACLLSKSNVEKNPTNAVKITCGT